MKKVFTTGQAAKICKVAPRTVSKWFDSGRLKGYRIPGSQDRRIPYDSLLKFLREYNMPTDEMEAEGAFRVLTVALTTELQQIMPATAEGQFQVHHANDEFAATFQVATPNYTPHVIVIDTLLGNGRVHELIRNFKAVEKLNATAVIVIAGEDNSQEEFDGASYVLRRPFAPETLNEQIRLYVPEAA